MAGTKKMKEQWDYQSIAVALTKRNQGKKRVPLPQMREAIKDLVEISSEIKPRVSPLNFLRQAAYELRKKKLAEIKKNKLTASKKKK